jgi:hypothetical protein
MLIAAVIVVLLLAAVMFRGVIRRIRWAEHSGQRQTWVSILVLLLAGLGVGGFFLGRELWNALKPTPDFTWLAEQPDDSLVGTVAFIATRGDGVCVDVISASGRNRKEAACFSAVPGYLEWQDDRRLRVLSFGPLERPQDRWGRVVDVVTGEVTDVPQAEVPEAGPVVDFKGPLGEVITSDSSGGRLHIDLTADRKTRTLLSVNAPSTYTVGGFVWSTTGGWFVAKDDLDQVLLVTTADPSVTRLLAKGAYAPAVLDVDLLKPAG